MFNFKYLNGFHYFYKQVHFKKYPPKWNVDIDKYLKV